jgi:MYXO-CTERM domain-containing protein
MKPTRNLFVSLLSLSAITLCNLQNAHAVLVTWDGSHGSQDVWTTKQNWNGAGNKTVPVAGDDLHFFGPGRSTTNSNNLPVATSFIGLTFDAGALAFTLNGNSITLAGNVVNSSTNTQTINFGVILSGSTRDFNAASGDLAVSGSGTISGGFGVNKTGNSTLTFATANTYTGDTTIKAGTLKFDGNASVLSTKIIVGDSGINGGSLDVSTNTVPGGFQVTGTQTLSGTGTVIGASTIQLNGIVAPGNSGAGVLNTGNINFASGSILEVDLNSAAAYDKLNVVGGVTLAGILDVDASAYTPNNTDLFFMVVNDGSEAISGTFSGVADLSTVTFGSQQFKVSYTGNYDTNSFTGGNDFVMQTVPEPSAALLGGLGALFLLRRRRNA